MLRSLSHSQGGQTPSHFSASPASRRLGDLGDNL